MNDQGYRLTTLGELGAQLPIGVSDEAGVHRTLDVRPWKTKDERELGKRKGKKQISLAKFVPKLLGYMVNQLGPHDFTDPKLKDAEKELRISQLFTGDVFYSYFWTRREAMGPDAHVQIKCSSCEHEFDYAADLDTLEVKVVEDHAALEWQHELRHPVELRKRRVTTVRGLPPRWQMMLGLHGNEISAKIGAVKSSIVGLNDDPEQIMLADVEIDELSKRDLEDLVTKIDSEFVGPNMRIEGTCPSCSAEFIAPIDWRYENFFRGSSG